VLMRSMKPLALKVKSETENLRPSGNLLEILLPVCVIVCSGIGQINRCLTGHTG